MSLSLSTEWEVRTTGSDLNSGGYNPSRSGTSTDYSQQDSSHATGSNAEIGSTTTDFIPDGYAPTSADVGNIVRVSGGTGFTPGYYEIVSIQTAPDRWRFDRAVGTAGSTGGSWVLGGALASIGQAGAILAASNQNAYNQTIHVKHGTYPIGGGSANTSGNSISFTNSRYCFGYEVTRYDDGAPPIFEAAADSITMMRFNGGRSWARNLEFSSVGTTGVAPIYISTSESHLDKIVVRGTPDKNAIEFASGALSILSDCYAEGGRYNFFVNSANGTLLNRCVSKQAAQGHFYLSASNGVVLVDCIASAIDGNTSATALTVATNARNVTVAGFLSVNASQMQLIGDHCVVENSITTNATTYNGFQFSSIVNSTRSSNCAVYNPSNSEFMYDPMFLENYIVLTQDPFTDLLGGDFTLNNTSGGGAELQSVPTTFAGLLPTSYPDIGAYQHLITSGGGGGPRIRHAGAIVI